jgi:hypothetical protein
MVVCAHHSNYAGSINRMNTVQACQGINARPYLKIPKAKKARHMVKMVECLSNKFSYIYMVKNCLKGGRRDGKEELSLIKVLYPCI